MFTAVLSIDTPETNVSSRVGMFDNDCGHFFSLDGTNTLAVNERFNGVDATILQTNWNYDKMDGSGSKTSNPSTYLIDNDDYTKAFIFFIDMEWLGFVNYILWKYSKSIWVNELD